MTGMSVRNIWNHLKANIGSWLSVIIALGTAGIHEIVIKTSFHCPCVEPAHLPRNECASEEPGLFSMSCTTRLNFFYGISFLIGPAVAFFLLGLALQSTMWRVVTGWCKRSSQYQGTFHTLWRKAGRIIGIALVSPVTWICIALIDGSHMACAFTPLPYNVGTGAEYSNCFEVLRYDNASYTPSFNSNQALSRATGWTTIGVVMIAGFLCYCINRCCSPLTYLQLEYQDAYRENEETAFEAKMQTKAKEESEENVEKFLSEQRSKADWDKISSSVRVQVGSKDQTVTTALQKWSDKADQTSQGDMQLSKATGESIA